MCQGCNTEAEGSHLVFVYGTLKRGEPNHYWMLEADQENELIDL